MTAILVAIVFAPAGEPEFAGRPLSAWVKQLKEDDTPRRRRAAAIALGQLGINNPETLPVVLASLGKAARNDGSPEVRRQAVSEIAQQKSDESTAAVEDLTEALRVEKVPAVRLELAIALGRFGAAAAPAVKPLTDCLPDADPKLRAEAAGALGRVGPAAAAATPVLLIQLNDQDPTAQREAVAAISRVKPTDTASVALALVKILSTTSPTLRRDLLESLGRLGDHGTPTLTAISDNVTHGNLDVRLAAINALSRFGVPAASAGGRLTTAFRTDTHARLRESAARALVSVWRAEPTKAINSLADRLPDDPSVEVRVTIVELLSGFGPVASSALPALRRARTDPDPRVRSAANEAIRRIEPKQ